jgi:hypothetical protein
VEHDHEHEYATTRSPSQRSTSNLTTRPLIHREVIDRLVHNNVPISALLEDTPRREEYRTRSRKGKCSNRIGRIDDGHRDKKINIEGMQERKHPEESTPSPAEREHPVFKTTLQMYNSSIILLDKFHLNFTKSRLD